MGIDQKEKRVIIKVPGTNHAEFKIRLNYDSLTQTAFFRAMMEGYISQDSSIVDYIERYKEDTGKQSRHRKKVVQKNTPKITKKVQILGPKMGSKMGKDD